MAEIIIKIRDSADSNALMAWKAWTPVDIQPDGFDWGKRPTVPPKSGGSFIIISVPLTTDEVNSLFISKWSKKLCDEERIFVAGAVKPELHPSSMRRVFEIAIHELAPEVIDKAMTSGKLLLTIKQFHAITLNRKTKERA